MAIATLSSTHDLELDHDDEQFRWVYMTMIFLRARTVCFPFPLSSGTSLLKFLCFPLQIQNETRESNLLIHNLDDWIMVETKWEGPQLRSPGEGEFDTHDDGRMGQIPNPQP